MSDSHGGGDLYRVFDAVLLFYLSFFLAIAFCVWLLWRDRNIWNCLRYGVSQGIAFALAYLTYPSFPGQMFRGQRGAQATENFFNLSNTFERVWFFLDLMNGYVFGYLFFVIVLVIVLLAAALRRRRYGGAEGKAGREEAEPGIEFVMLLAAVTGYFLAVSKTALLLGETSNRYQLPIYGIVVLLVLMTVRTLWRRVKEIFKSARQGDRRVLKPYTEEGPKKDFFRAF